MKYFDNCATTVMDDSVVNEMSKAFQEDFFNPSSLYAASTNIKVKMNTSRKSIADALMCSSDEIIFTGSGTESNNLAIFGSLKKKSGRIISSLAEHPSIYNCMLQLKSRGYDVVFAALNKNGSVDVDRFLEVLTKDTLLVALSHVNNETGAITDIKRICALVKENNKNCRFICDGMQALGKISINVVDLDVDIYTISAHKIHGPKGIGGMYLKKNTSLNAIMFGGEQENKLRPGTENVPAIYAFGHATRLAIEQLDVNTSNYHRFRNIITDILNNTVKDFFLISKEGYAPPIISLAFSGIKSQIIMHMLEDEGIYVGNGSACSSKSIFSRVSQAIGIQSAYIEGIIRICFCKYNSEHDVVELANKLAEKVNSLREIIGGKP